MDSERLPLNRFQTAGLTKQIYLLRYLKDGNTAAHFADSREIKLDVYGKRQTAKIQLLPSVFSSLYSRIKIFVFAVNSKRHFSIFV